MGSGFESQGAHFTENPADSSESAGFLRSLINTVLSCEVHIILFASGFDARKTVFALVPTGDPSSLRFGHPDVTTGDTVFLAWLPGAAAEDICTSACISIRGALRSRRGCGRFAGGFVCAPCLANWGGGGLSRFGLLRGGWMFCVQAQESPPQLSEPRRANAKLNYRTGQIRVTNSRKSFTSLPCSSRPVP